jgi:hypothetical protein
MTNLERAYEKLNGEINRPVVGNDTIIVALSRPEAQALRLAALNDIANAADQHFSRQEDK